jgi:mannose-1-phosphate guanylyltransferase
MKTAVIIAGGEGSRLKPYTNNIPKTLVKVAGRPLLYWIIKWLKMYGINHLVIGVAYKKEKIYSFMKKNKNFGIDVDFSEHTVDGGTAEAFRLAIERHVKDEDFIGMNSDELANLNLNSVIKKHKKYKPIVTMVVSPFYCRFSVVNIKDKTEITGFEYGKKLEKTNVSVGIYIFNRKILKFLPKRGSIETDTFYKLTNSDRMIAYRLSGNEGWASVNTHKDIIEAEGKLKEWGYI